MSVILYFISILLTGALAGFLAWYAWQQRNVPGSRAYAGLALSECLLALAEVLSVLSPTPALALFWFEVRFLPLSALSVMWLVFTLGYSGRNALISKRLLAGLFIIPVLSQVLLWSNSLRGLWLQQEVSFHQSGLFWLADIRARIPGPGFLVYSFYGLILHLAGIVLLFSTAWRIRRHYRGQALLLASAGITAFVFGINTIVNLIPRTEFNPFTPGIGLSLLLIALAVFRFQFLKRAPAAEADSKTRLLEAQMEHSLVVFMFIFLLMATGIAAGGYLSYQNYERQFRSQAESQLASIAELKVNGLEAWRAERKEDAQVVRQNPVFAALVTRYLENPADVQAQAQLQIWLDLLHGSYHYDRVFLLDARGVERVASPATPKPVAAHLVQDTAAILSTGQVTFLDFHRDTADGPIYLAVVAPIYAGQDGRPLGILVLRIDPHEYLYPYLQQWPVPSVSAETLLVRREGTDVLYLNELRFQTDAALNRRIPLANTEVPAVKAALGQEGIVEGVDYRGVSVIAALHAVPDSPWFLVTRMDTAEVYAPLRERLWQTVVFIGALLAAAGAGLGLIWRQQRVRYYRGQVAAAQALQESEEKFRSLTEQSPNMIFINQRGRVVYANRKCAEIMGYTREEFYAETFDFADIIAPEYVDQVKANLVRHTRGEEAASYEYALITKDGKRIEAILAMRLIEYGGENAILGTVMDITARKQAEARLAHLNEVLRAVRNVNQLITRERDPQQLMSDACAILVQTRGYRMAWVGLIEEGHSRVTPAARAGQGMEYLDQVTITWDESETGQGPSGTAIRTRRPATCADVATDPRFAPWREAALQHGFASLVAVPVLGGERLFGVVNVYADKPNAFDEEEISLLTELANDLGFALQSIEDEAERKRAEEQTRQLLAESEQSRRSLLSVLEDEKQAEEALAQERNLLRTLIDNLPDYVWVKDAESRFVVGNIAVARSFGKTRPEELYGMTDFDYHAPELAAQFHADEQAVLRSGQPLINREESVIEPAGSRKWLLSTKVPLRDSQGNVAGLVGIGRDITRLKQAEEGLRRSADRLALLHTIDQATLALQPLEAIAALAVRGMRDLTSCSRADVALLDPSTGEFMVLAIHSEDETGPGPGARFPLAASLCAQLQRGEAQVIADLQALPDLPPVLQSLQRGGLRSFVGVPIRTEEKLIGLLHLVADHPAAFSAEDVEMAREIADQLAVAIQQARLREQVARHTAELEQRVAERTAELTETAARLQTANEQLKELDLLKSQFVSNVSHELRTPLTNIKAYLHLLEHGKPEKHAQYMTTLHSETSHLEHLIEDLLDISRLDQGKMRIRLAAVDVNRVMAMLVDARALLVTQAGLTLDVLPQPELPPALADADRLMQVLINLLANATNYTPQDGTITLRTGLQQAEGRSWVTVAVSDTGLGIAAEELPHIFERFYRGAAARQRNVPGTGLGLAICQEIVQRHDGKITVESQVGVGSTFTVWLPVEGDRVTG